MIRPLLLGALVLTAAAAPQPNQMLVPTSCSAPLMRVIERQQMATAMRLGPTAARITAILPQYEGAISRVNAAPGLITCPLMVTFSDGAPPEIGYFTEWVQQDGQMMVSWGDNPLPFGPQYRRD